MWGMKSEPQSAETIKPMLHAEHLEQLIDAYGLPRLPATFAEIAHAKAEHVQTNWQDKQLAGQWTIAAQKLERLSLLARL